MRLRLDVRRHNLPAIKILWNTAGLRPGAAGPGYQTTTAQLLEQVNEVVQLEGQATGLDDYVAEVNGYECLHFSILEDVLVEDAEITIRPLEFRDRRSRRVSGRQQISNDGRHLIDGVAFGRPFVRAHDHAALEEADVVPDEQLLLSGPGNDDDENEDDDYEDLGSDEESRDLLDDVVELELEQRQAAASTSQAHPPTLLDSPFEARNTRSKRKRMEGLAIADAGLSSALLSGTSSPEIPLRGPKRRRTSEQISARNVSEINSVRSSARSVRFANGPDDTPATLRMVGSSENDSSSEESSLDEDTMSSSTMSDKENRVPVRSQSAKKSPSGKKSASSNETSTSEEQSEDSVSSSYDADSSTDIDDSEEDTSSDSFSEVNESDESATSEKLSRRNVNKHEANARHRPESQKALSHAAEPSSKSPLIEDPSLNGYIRNLYKAADANATIDQSRSPPTVPPGAGLRRTQARNQRRTAKKRLQRTIDAGLLPSGATFKDLQVHDEQNMEQDTGLALNLAIEEKRRALLSSIASGGIEVSPPPLKGQKHPNRTGIVRMASLSNAEESPQKSTRVQQKDQENKIGRDSNDNVVVRNIVDDMTGTLQQSKVSNDGELQTDLAAPTEPLPRSRSANENPVRESLAVEESLDQASLKAQACSGHQESPGLALEPLRDNSLRIKVILTAFECSGEPKFLPAPPFPFVQRWHGRGRNSKSHVNSKMTPFQKEIDEGGRVDLQRFKDAFEAAEVLSDREDLPPLPENTSLCPPLDSRAIKAGAIIAFKRLEMSKATSWSPTISDLRTAKIIETRADGTIHLELAKRDQETIEKQFDPRTGQRVYSGFEAPEDVESAIEDEEAGHIVMELGEMIDPILIREAPKLLPALACDLNRIGKIATPVKGPQVNALYDKISGARLHAGCEAMTEHMVGRGLFNQPSGQDLGGHDMSVLEGLSRTSQKTAFGSKESYEAPVPVNLCSSKTTAESFYTASSVVPDTEHVAQPTPMTDIAPSSSPVEYDSWQPVTIGDDDDLFLPPSSDGLRDKIDVPDSVKVDVPSNLQSAAYDPFDSSPIWPPAKRSSVTGTSPLRRSTRLRTPNKQRKASPTQSNGESSGPPSLSKLLSQPSQPERSNTRADSKEAHDDFVEGESIVVSPQKRRRTFMDEEPSPSRKLVRTSAPSQSSPPAANTRNRSRESAVELTQTEEKDIE